MKTSTISGDGESFKLGDEASTCQAARVPLAIRAAEVSGQGKAACEITLWSLNEPD